MGNPPFLGYSVQTREQKLGMLSLFREKAGNLYSLVVKIDYIAGWYYKAFEMVQDTRIRTAFVSTNSIKQVEQVTYIFKTLNDRYGI